MTSDHIQGLVLGVGLSASAASFFVWAYLNGHFKDTEEAANKAYEAEMGEGTALKAQSKVGDDSE